MRNVSEQSTRGESGFVGSPPGPVLWSDVPRDSCLGEWLKKRSVHVPETLAVPCWDLPRVCYR